MQFLDFLERAQQFSGTAPRGCVHAAGVSDVILRARSIPRRVESGPLSAHPFGNFAFAFGLFTQEA